jgi:CheY-like chemotaxis protein
MAAKAILVVDDEAILLLSLKQALRLRFGEGYRYETALSGLEGLDRIEALDEEGVEVVLIISDWLMPGMKGDEFFSAVHERRSGIKLVMLTGHADESDISRLAEEVKLEAFLRKPYDPERLFAIVAKALE